MKAARLLCVPAVLALLVPHAGSGQPASETPARPRAEAAPRLPDLPGSGAKVPWSDFARILEELKRGVKPPEKVPEPPVGSTVGRSALSAVVAPDGKSLTVAAVVDLEVLTEEQWVTIPLAGDDVAVSRATLDGKPAPLVPVSGQLALVLRGKGAHRLEATFAVPVSESQGTSSAGFRYSASAATSLEVAVPGKGLELTPSPGVLVSRTEAESGSRFLVALPATSYVSLSWRRAREEAAADVAGEGKVHAEVRTLVTVGEGVMSATSLVDYRLYKRKLSELRIAIPKEMRLLDAEGSGIGERKEEEIGGERVVSIALSFEAEESYRVTLTYERALDQASADVPLPLLVVKDVDRQTGFVGVAAAGSVEVTETGALTDIATIDISELPPDFSQLGSEPVLYAHRYIRTPYAATLEVRRHADLEVKRAIVERADLVSFYTADGNVLTHACYQVKNNQKQFLALALPAGATVWGSYLSGRPVKAAKQGDAVLLPLEKAGASDAGARASTVEIVYHLPSAPFKGGGKPRAVAPSVDLECLQMTWQLFLPIEYRYFAVGGDLEERAQELVPPARPRPIAATVPTTTEEEEKPQQDFERNERMLSNVQVAQGRISAVPQSRSAGEALGVLPVRIDVPREGFHLTLEKRLVKPLEAPEVTFAFHRALHVRAAQGIQLLVALAFGLALVSVLRAGTDSVRRRQGAMLLFLLVGVALSQWMSEAGPAPTILGFSIPAAIFLARQLARQPRAAGPPHAPAPGATPPPATGATAALVLAAVAMAASARAASAEPQPPELPGTELTIPWGDMKRLMEDILESQVPEKAVPPPPTAFAVTSGKLRGVVAGDLKSCTLEMELAVDVLEPEQWVSVPLPISGASFLDASLDGKPAPLSTASGEPALVLRGAGSHLLAARMAVPVSHDRGTWSIYFPYPQATATELTLAVPQSGMEVIPGRGVVVERREEGGQTVALLALSGGGGVSISWRKQADEGPSKVEGKVQAEVKTLVGAGEGVLSVVTTVEYKLFQRKLTRFSVALPAEAVVLDVQGSGVQETKDVEKDGRRIVTATLPYEAEGSYQLTISYELKVGAQTTPLPLVEVLDVDRQSGWIGVGARTNVEVAEASEPEDLAGLDPSELPRDLAERSGSAVLHAYRYIKVPYALELRVTRHDEIELKRSIVESAAVEAFFGRDGKVLSRAVYQVKNNQKQFLRVTLPEGAEMWGAYVSGKPVKAAKDDKGGLLVPLHKSKVGEANMRPFPVELVYFGEQRAFWGLGRKVAAVPATDLECLELSLTTYVPEAYAAYGFAGDLKRWEAQTPVSGEGIGWLAGARDRLDRTMADPATTAPPDLVMPKARHHERGEPLRDVDEPMDDPELVVDEKRKELEALGYTNGDKDGDDRGDASGVEGGVVGGVAGNMPGGTLGGDAPAKQSYYYNQAAQKAGSAKGVLPVRVEVPREGRAHTFTRKLVRPGERPEATFWFLSRDLVEPLHGVLILASLLLATLVLSTIAASSYQQLSAGRAGMLLALLGVVLAVRFLALGDTRAILIGAGIPIVLQVLFLVLRREHERL